MKTIEHDGKQYKVQFSNFRGSHGPNAEQLSGCHGKDQKECGACVLYTIAAVLDGENVYTGLAKRSKLDQFNKRTGRSIASGRALKSITQFGTKQTYYFEHVSDYIKFLKGLRELELNGQNTNDLTSLQTRLEETYNVKKHA